MTMGKILYFNRQGERTLSCKDTVYFVNSSRLGVYSLADGLNSLKWSHIGASAVQKAVADMAAEKGDELFTESEQDVQRNLIEIVHRTLYNLAEKQGSPDDYASTMMTVFVSKKSGCMRWLHIGDGLILKEDVSGNLSVLSHPHNGMTRQFTYTTAHDQLDRYMRMGTKPLKGVRRLIMMTDGAAFPFYRNRKLTGWGKWLIGRGIESVLAELEKIGPADDYSMIDVFVNDREG